MSRKKQQTKEERAKGVSNEELTYGKKGRPIVVTDVPEDFVNELKETKEAATANVAAVNKEEAAQ